MSTIKQFNCKTVLLLDVNIIHLVNYIQNQIKIHKINVYKAVKMCYNYTMKNENKSNDHSNYELNSKRKEVIFYESSSLTKSSSITTNQLYKMKRIHKMKEQKDMNKTELNELVNDLQVEIQTLNETQLTLETHIIDLQMKLESSSKDGRKSQVLELLRKHETISILEISRTLNISTKNVSSQLTYLRSDNYKIFTDHRGRKMLIEDRKTDEDSLNNEDSLDKDDIENIVDSAESEESSNEEESSVDDNS